MEAASARLLPRQLLQHRCAQDAPIEVPVECPACNELGKGALYGSDRPHE